MNKTARIERLHEERDDLLTQLNALEADLRVMVVDDSVPNLYAGLDRYAELHLLAYQKSEQIRDLVLDQPKKSFWKKLIRK